MAAQRQMGRNNKSSKEMRGKSPFSPPHRIYSEDSCSQGNRSFSSGWEVIFKKSKASCVLVRRLLLEEEEAQSWRTGSGGRVGGDVVLGGNGKNK